MRMYEIFHGDDYHFTVLDSDGDPFVVIENEQRHTPSAKMVLVENGERIEVVGPIVNDNRIESDEDLEWFDESELE